ncbi:MAG: amidohydrolase family protein [Chloroflexi bacterium]|nr:amidohydrolase family protein [Chloroflexota bacterium]
MRVIDSDAHVVENDHTWDFVDPSDARFRPVYVEAGEKGAAKSGWLIDGRIRGFAFPRLERSDLEELSRKAGRRMDMSPTARDLSDVDARIGQMDELGIDTQVVYSSIFIEQVADRPEVEVPICQSWNRWMADIWKAGGGRIRWVCVPPALSMPDALEQIRFGTANGACGVLLQPIVGDRLLTDPYFYPIYEEAQRRNVPIAIHIANGNPPMCDTLVTPGAGGFWRFRLFTVGCFHALMASEVPNLFPTLRFAFVEAAAQWVPYVLLDLNRRLEGLRHTSGESLLKQKRFYVTCQTDDDVPYIIRHAGEDNLVVGTDYGHTDQSTELDSLRLLRSQPGLTESQWRKIVDDNARALYGL